ncbi:MAG TPA: hypothetical protein VK358_07005 [Longimicrobium sp.]|nr:hypothetical protein [Longimicrobium sp.]
MALLSFFRRAAGAAALALLAGGCDFLYPPTYVPADAEQLVVHAVLESGRDTAAVLVTRVGTVEPVAVSGARVRLAGPAGTLVLEERAGPSTPCTAHPVAPGDPQLPRTGCYAAAVPGRVRAGAEYLLEIDVPSGERVRGRTVVPAAPVVLAPQERLRVPARETGSGLRSVDPVTLRWTAAASVGLVARAERGWVRNAVGARCGAYLDWGFIEPGEAVPDSLRARVEASGCSAGANHVQVQPDSVEVMLGVTVYDSAYHHYFRNTDDGIPLERASSGLEGAFGLFGSAATSGRRVVLFKQ